MVVLLQVRPPGIIFNINRKNIKNIKKVKMAVVAASLDFLIFLMFLFAAVDPAGSTRPPWGSLQWGFGFVYPATPAGSTLPLPGWPGRPGRPDPVNGLARLLAQHLANPVIR